MTAATLTRRMVLLFTISCAACTSFSTVRSAVVNPGASLLAQASVTAPAGDQASWFYSFDCAENCNRSIPSTDFVLSYGHTPSAGRGSPFTFGIGLSGIHLYAEGYVQLGQSPRTPYGIGARVGTQGHWWEHQLYARVNKRVGASTLLWNPAVYYYTGNSPNGENPGSVRALVNGFGLEYGDGPVVVTPSVSLVVSRAQHSGYGRTHGPETRVFPTAAVSLMFRRSPIAAR